MTTQRRSGLLDFIERVGNWLPDPATLFLGGLFLVMGLSWVASATEWTVEKKLPTPVMQDATGEDGETIQEPILGDDGAPILEWVATGDVKSARNLVSNDGIEWLLSSLVDNFMAFPPLGVVLVGMLGIGIAERTGLMATLLKAFMLVVPSALLTPAMIFIGIMSSMTLDAGYVILPPLAGLLYLSVGRSPVAGIAAVFAGVAAGFNANLFVTSLDPMLAEFTQLGARVIEDGYEVNPAANWGFMFVSTFVITLAGWGTTSFFVERRLKDKPPEEGGPAPMSAADLDAQRLQPAEIRAALWAFGSFALLTAIACAMIFIPDMPLHGLSVKEDGTSGFAKWVNAIVPMLFILFVIPGLVYGVVIGTIQDDKSAARLMVESMAAMAPIIVLAFFAAQFIEAFKWSGLDVMLALAGGQALGQADMPIWMLIVIFIGLTIVFNLFVGSMSAKYAMFAPIFVPMFMLVGISPELTQAAYRIGDSVSNIITPLNAYLIIVLVFLQKYVPKGGMGTLISTMLPYTIVFSIVWTLMLVLWMALGIPLGFDGGLTYTLPSVAEAAAAVSP